MSDSGGFQGLLRTGNPTCALIGADTVMTVAADSHRASPAFGGLRPAVSQPFVFFYYTKTARVCQAIASAASCGKSAPICRKAGRRAFSGRKGTSARRRPDLSGGIYAAVEPSCVIRVAVRSAAAIRLPALRVPRRSDSFCPRGISCEINMRGYEINAPQAHGLCYHNIYGKPYRAEAAYAVSGAATIRICRDA